MNVSHEYHSALRQEIPFIYFAPRLPTLFIARFRVTLRQRFFLHAGSRFVEEVTLSFNPFLGLGCTSRGEILRVIGYLLPVRKNSSGTWLFLKNI